MLLSERGMLQSASKVCQIAVVIHNLALQDGKLRHTNCVRYRFCCVRLCHPDLHVNNCLLNNANSACNKRHYQLSEILRYFALCFMIHIVWFGFLNVCKQTFLSVILLM